MSAVKLLLKHVQCILLYFDAPSFLYLKKLFQRGGSNHCNRYGEVLILPCEGLIAWDEYGVNRAPK